MANLPALRDLLVRLDGPNVLRDALVTVLDDVQSLKRDPGPRRVRVVNRSGHPLTYATDGSIGIDLRACIGTYRDVDPGRRWIFDTGVSVELPPGLGALVQPRSGLARDHGVIAATGVIDRDYRGTIAVNLFNTGTSHYRVHPGDRIGQLVIVAAPAVELVEVDELGDTARGTHGFGSTGR